jgi:SAM-dependent methyltransferase
MQKKLNNYKKINYCRLCNSKKVKLIHNFGLIPLGNNLQGSILKSLKCKKYPLTLMNCQKCNHFQLSISVNPKILYAKNYTYLTGVTKAFRKHFFDYSKWVIKKCGLKKNSSILEIGSNDGTCLNFFKKNNMKVLGIDPANKPCAIANNKGIKTLNNFFNKQTANQIQKKFGKFDLITSHNVLAHTINIKEIFKSVFKILNQNAFFCFEIGYFKKVIEKNLFDTIYHEHLDYHHANPLIKVLEDIGFSILDISTNNIQGGTLRLLLQKKSKYIKKKKIKKFLLKEKIFFKKIDIKKKFQDFNKILSQLNIQVMKEIKNKKNIYAYGSPTKASLLLIISRLNKMIIKNSFEDNILKCNRYIPGTDIKIINTEKIILKRNSIIIILAWNFVKEIIERLKKKNVKNIKLFVPLPKFIVKKI